MGKKKQKTKRDDVVKEKQVANLELQKLNTKLSGLKNELAELRKKENGYREQLETETKTEAEGDPENLVIDEGAVSELFDILNTNKDYFLNRETRGEHNAVLPVLIGGTQAKRRATINELPSLLKQHMEPFKHVMLFKISFTGETPVSASRHLSPFAQISARTVHHICSNSNFNEVAEHFDETVALHDVVLKLMSTVETPWDWDSVAVLLTLDAVHCLCTATDKQLLTDVVESVLHARFQNESPYFIFPVLNFDATQEELLQHFLTLKPHKTFIKLS